MPNPFDNEYYAEKTYSKFVYDQVCKMELGDSMRVDLGFKDKESFRMTLKHISNGCGAGFATRKDGDELWVKRIK